MPEPSPDASGLFRAFPLPVVLSVTHGLPSELDPYLDIVAFLVGGPASVHTPKAPLIAWIIEQHPLLVEVDRPAGVRTAEQAGGRYTAAEMDAWDRWALNLVDRLGATVILRPLPADRRDLGTLMDQVLDTGVDAAKVWHMPGTNTWWFGGRDS